MSKIIFQTITCICLITVSHLNSWSLNEIAADTSETISGWFTKEQKKTSSKEYPVKPECAITVTNHTGSISITTWNKPTLMVEATKRGSEQDINHAKFTVTVNDEDATVTINSESRISTKKSVAIDYALIVPQKASLIIRTELGNISTQETHGNLDLQTLSGSISIEQSSKTVHAKTPNGSITAEQRTVSADASIFLDAEYDITLIMPENANARISASTIQGKINSDIFITLDPLTTTLNKDAYKRMQQQIWGTTGAGGPPITLESTRGTIQIIGS